MHADDQGVMGEQPTRSCSPMIDLMLRSARDQQEQDDYDAESGSHWNGKGAPFHRAPSSAQVGHADSTPCK